MSASYSTLIGAVELAQRLRDPDWVVFDCRFDLADPAFGSRAYARGHLPGAFFVDRPSYMIDVLLSETYEVLDGPSGDVVTETDERGKWRHELVGPFEMEREK